MLSNQDLQNKHVFISLDDNDEFGFNNISTYEGHLHLNSISIWFNSDTLFNPDLYTERDILCKPIWV